MWLEGRITDVNGQDLGAAQGDAKVDSQAEETTKQEVGVCQDVEKREKFDKVEGGGEGEGNV